MKYIALIIFAGLLNACVSTMPAQDNPALEVRPVKNLVQNKDDFDMVAAMKVAKENYVKGHYENSYEQFKQILLRDKSLIDARIGLADNALALGQVKQAYEIFLDLPRQELTANDRARVEAGLVLSEVASNQANDPKGRLESILSKHTTDARIWNALGKWFDQNGEWMQAIDMYVGALKYTDQSAKTINNIGISLLKQGRYEESLEKFNQAIQLKADIPIYHSNRRLTLLLLGRYSQAFINLKDRQSADLFNDAGYIKMIEGDKVTAKTFFNQAITLSPVYHQSAVENLSLLEKG